MYKPKKAVAAVCAAAILLSPTGVLAAQPSDFVDFPNDWSRGAMTAAVENGLLVGVSEGRIAPRGQVTRAQMAAIINRAFASEKTASLAGYTDVANGAWYANDMAKAVQMGTFSGTGNGKLEPERAITREEAFSVLARAFALDAGNKSALDRFSDGAQVSNWAAGSLAAMVENGYVNGSDGNRLNPKQTITRAEFAAVMSKIVAQYIDADDVAKSRSTVIDGNVIVRDNVDLSGYTINGDIIVADEADTVTLKNVTVTGRIVVRSASDKLTLTDSKADGVILTNPNGAVILDSEDSDLGTITALSDLTLAGGSLDKLTVGENDTTITVKDGAKVGDITVTADNVKITGAGDVDTVHASANNVAVTVKGAKVTAGQNATGVTAGSKDVKPGETETVKDTTSNGGNTSNPGNSGTNTPWGGNNNNSGNTGDNNNNGGEEVPASAIVNEAHTKLVDLGWSQYVTIQFANGHSLKDSKVIVDGTDVTSVVTPVSDDGSIVKWEITDLNPALLTVESDGHSQKVKLSNNANPEKPAVVKAEDSAPDYMIAHGPLASWDYYLPNYDKNGKVRIEPGKTTFNLTGVETTDVPAFYSSDAEISDGDSFGSVKGEVVIKFEQKTDADKAWFNAVADNKANTVQLVAANDNMNTLNKNLTYTKGTENTENGTNGTITIKLGQPNFYSNGRYYVRVQSAGHDTALVPIHVVNAEAPELQLSGSGSAIQSGQDVSFTIKNMTYGITNPTYAAELTRPDGTTVQLTMINDWYQIGDLLKLYNTPNTDETDGDDNNIPYNGKYTLTVHSNGFKDMSCSFTVKGGKDVPQTKAKAVAYGVDALSSATGGGSIGGGSEGGGGGSAISADLKYDADLLANAQLLDKLGIKSAAAEGIVNRWETEMAGWDTVWTNDGTAYDYEDYFNAVEKAEDKGDYLSFNEYVNSGADKYTRGTPYTIKSVLEDNKLGDIQQNGSWVGVNPPALTLVDAKGEKIDVVYEGNDVILKSADADYFKKLEKVNVNNNSLNLNKDQYTVAGDTLTIMADKVDNFKTGERNTIRLSADGYKDSVLSIDYQRDVEENLTLKADKDSYERESDITLTVNGSEGDFLKNLKAVVVTKPDGKESNVDKKGQNAWASEATYEVGADNKTLTISDPEGKFFAANGNYTVKLYAEGYNELSASFAITDKSGGSEDPDQPVDTTTPKATGIKLHEKEQFQPAYYAVTLTAKNEASLKAYLNQASEGNFTVTVNGQEYKRSVLGISMTDEKAFSIIDGTLDLTTDGFNADGNTTVTVRVNGYDDLIFVVNKDGGLGEGEEGGNPGGGGDVTETKEVPKYMNFDKDEVDYNGFKQIVFSQNFENEKTVTPYLNAINEVTVNGVPYTKVGNRYQMQDNNYVVTTGGVASLGLKSNGFSQNDNTTIVVKATGYKDFTLTVDKDGNVVSDSKPGGGTEQPDQPGTEAKDAPQATGAYKDSDKYNIRFEDLKDDMWKNNISVTVNDTPYMLDTDYFFGPNENEYKWVLGSEGNELQFDPTAFTKEENTITISADGYKDLVITVDKDGNIVTK